MILSKTSAGGERTIHGVEMEDGTVLTADNILSGCSPYTTFIELMGDNKPIINELNSNPIHKKEKESVKSGHTKNSELPQEFVHHLQHTDFSCGAFKSNCAVDRLPNFTCYPSPLDGKPGPMHMGEKKTLSIILPFSFSSFPISVNFFYFFNFLIFTILVLQIFNNIYINFCLYCYFHRNDSF